MPIAPFRWDADILRELVNDWIVDLRDFLDDLEIIADMESELPKISEERWRYYSHIDWRNGLDPLCGRLKDLVLRETGVALLKCGSGLTADQARLIQLILGCRFGENVTQTAERDRRPLSAIVVKDDPTADHQYSGNSLKRGQIGFHTDGSGTTDREVTLLSMLCIRPARFGGQSRVANSQCAFDSLSQSTQAILRTSFPRENPYDPDHQKGVLKNEPIFQPLETGQQYMLFSYHPDRIRNGVRWVEGPLRPEIEAAFCSLEEALETYSCDINLLANDIIFLNNHVVAHDRRSFWDDLKAPRLLERFWGGRFLTMAAPNPAPAPQIGCQPIR
jgi:alpha-ketoglutarate-dependent taurine dioxygenase